MQRQAHEDRPGNSEDSQRIAGTTRPGKVEVRPAFACPIANKGSKQTPFEVRTPKNIKKNFFALERPSEPMRNFIFALKRPSGQRKILFSRWNDPPNQRKILFSHWNDPPNQRKILFSHWNDPQDQWEILFSRWNDPQDQWKNLFSRWNDPQANEKIYFRVDCKPENIKFRGLLLWNVARAACREQDKCAWAQGLPPQ